MAKQQRKQVQQQSVGLMNAKETRRILEEDKAELEDLHWRTIQINAIRSINDARSRLHGTCSLGSSCIIATDSSKAKTYRDRLKLWLESEDYVVDTGKSKTNSLGMGNHWFTVSW